MSAACALNIRTPLRRDLPFSLPRKNHAIHYVSLHGVVKNTAFPALQAISAIGRQRFTMMCMPCYSYDVQQSSAAYVSKSTTGDDRSGLADDNLDAVLNFEEVTKVVEALGVALPLDMLESAKTTGIPKLCLQRYLCIESLGWGLDFAMRSCSMFRNQMMIDPFYLTGLGKQFASEGFMDVMLAYVMKMIGRRASEIAIFLLLMLAKKVVIQGIIAPFEYAGRIRQRQTSISSRFMDNSNMFVAERAESLRSGAYCWAAVYCCAATFFSLILFV